MDRYIIAFASQNHAKLPGGACMAAYASRSRNSLQRFWVTFLKMSVNSFKIRNSLDVHKLINIHDINRFGNNHVTMAMTL